MDFESLDGRPVDFAFLLLAPEGAGADHLKALAQVARILREPGILDRIRAARDAHALYVLLHLHLDLAGRMTGPRLSRPRALPFAVAATLLAVPLAARAQQGAADGTCARDVLVAQSMQRQAIDQLEQADGDDAKNCRIWRRHVDTMRRVAGVYGRCLSGAASAAPA